MCDKWNFSKKNVFNNDPSVHGLKIKGITDGWNDREQAHLPQLPFAIEV